MTNALTGVAVPNIIARGGVSLAGMIDDTGTYPFNLAAGITLAHIGLAVTIDPSAPTQVKLAGDGDYIIGRLETVELRLGEGISVGTVATRGGLTLQIDPTVVGTVEEPLIGWSITGTTSGGNPTGLVRLEGTYTASPASVAKTSPGSKWVVDKNTNVSATYPTSGPFNTVTNPVVTVLFR